MRAPSVWTVIAAVNSNHAKAALLAVGGRIFQSFKGANPRIIDFGLPVESGLSLFLVAESAPLLRSEILDDHSQPSPFGPKSADAPALPSVKVNFLLTPPMGNVVGVRPISSGRAGGRGPVKLAVDGLFGQARDHADVDGVCSRCGICPAHFVREAWVGSPGRKSLQCVPIPTP